ncbi:MAG: hypothetical protein K6E80_00535 [Schwartzia sp.]|nr:hypothetical protein [Schwartzia sp. (in: firmicutes)]
MKRIVYLTDLYYEAKGRKYYEEDLYITGRLKEYFDVAICHPKNSEAFESSADLVVFRNTGAVSGFKDVYSSFMERVGKNKIKTFNDFTGKADMRGKQYLVDLTLEGYPVIPTVDSVANIGRLPVTSRYVIKPKGGADSIGLEFLSGEELRARNIIDGEYLIQPAIDFEYEVSFYFINDKMEYAMYAPDKSQRWRLEAYEADKDDVAFAEKFIKWNDIKNGIQRVDACRTKEGELLLVELEDLNPYLSILELDEAKRNTFIADMIDALNGML